MSMRNALVKFSSICSPMRASILQMELASCLRLGASKQRSC
jgi:hypothetical protein